MDLKEYVLTYRKEGETTPLVNIADYYETYVKPLNKVFEKASFHSSRTVICCFHDDINPSLGTINHKYLKGVKIFHCFGCGVSGDVIRMHQRIQEKYHHRRISEDESALELCKLYGIDAEKFKVLQDSGEYSGYVQKQRRISDGLDVYTLADFSSDLLPAREMSRGMLERLAIANSAIIKMTATKKKLFD